MIDRRFNQLDCVFCTTIFVDERQEVGQVMGNDGDTTTLVAARRLFASKKKNVVIECVSQGSVCKFERMMFKIMTLLSTLMVLLVTLPLARDAQRIRTLSNS